MNKEMEERIEKFLDVFMLEEYKGHDHSVARAHYREVFKKLVPEHFDNVAGDTNSCASSLRMETRKSLWSDRFPRP